MRGLVGVVVALSLLGTVTAQGSQEAWPSCGDLNIVLRNLDLQPEDDGAMHVGGQYFFHFQVIGETAAQVDSVAMSLGPVVEDYDESACDSEPWFTGPYLMNFRADRDASDGFFLPAKTQDLPDGAYAGALHAYDAEGNEIGRSWGRSVIDNCDGPEGSRCDDDPEQMLAHDIGMPWPILLPGDGVALEGKHFSIEFAEPISSLYVSLNGQNITSQMEEWEGRVWDDDVIPDSSPTGGEGPTGDPCTHPADTCIKLGPAYMWNGRALTDKDVLHVEAIDLAGNIAKRDLHVGAGVNGGLLLEDGPVLSISVDKLEKVAKPGESVFFTFTMQNTGTSDAHPFTSYEVPSGWGARFQDHEKVGRGEFAEQQLTIDVPLDATENGNIKARIAWPSNGGEKELTWDLLVVVPASGESVSNPGEVPQAQADSKDSPGGTIAIGLACLALALVVRRK